jgi:hypothetical protein
VIKSVGHNRLMSYNPHGIHILKIITMDEMKANVENSNISILEVAWRYFIKVFITPRIWMIST